MFTASDSARIELEAGFNARFDYVHEAFAATRLDLERERLADTEADKAELRAQGVDPDAPFVPDASETPSNVLIDDLPF